MDYLKQSELLIPANLIQQAVKRLADDISRDFTDEHPVLLTVLEGGRIFSHDLQENLTLPFDAVEIKASSYSMDFQSSGEPVLSNLPDVDFTDKTVLIIDDLIDTGQTLEKVHEWVASKHPSLIKTCLLAIKPDNKMISIEPTYVAFEIPPDFIFGYGTDIRGLFRDLPEIRVLKQR